MSLKSSMKRTPSLHRQTGKMSCVSLVCTVHGEKGLANISELRAILERIRPEVIFLELPPESFYEYFLVGSRSDLESISVKQYCEGRQGKLVLVDRPPPDEAFFRDHQYLSKTIEDRSSEYCRLIDLNSSQVPKHGFAYLNSELCSKLWSDVDKEMLVTIGKIGEPKLVEIYESWIRTNNLREKEWIENIQQYCRENTFEKGVFLAGAAHRQSIIDKASEHSAADATRIQWDFSGWLSI